MTDTDSPAGYDQAVALVQSYCGWHIAPSQQDVLTLDGNGSRTIMLPSLHVTVVNSVSVDGTVLDASAYDWSEAGIIELRCGRFPDRFRCVVVDFWHGYEEFPAPVQAVLSQLWEDGMSGSLVQVGQVRYAAPGSNGDAEVVTIQAILDRYKLPPRP